MRGFALIISDSLSRTPNVMSPEIPLFLAFGRSSSLDQSVPAVMLFPRNTISSFEMGSVLKCSSLSEYLFALEVVSHLAVWATILKGTKRKIR
ncbi:hypothetical protein D3C85_1246980 [compost metagenome]